MSGQKVKVKKVIHEGYQYSFSCDSKKAVLYRCIKRSSGKCPAVLYITKSNDEKMLKNQHNHEKPTEEKLAARRLYERMKDAMKAGGSTPNTVIAKNAIGVDHKVLRELPSKKSLIRMLSKHSSYPPNPKTSNFEIVDKYKSYVLKDSGAEDPSRIIALGDKNLVSCLQNRVILGDGTFKQVPFVLGQLYTWHAQIGDKYMPCIYFLLKNQSGQDYFRMFEMLKELIVDFVPKRILMDFELACIQAARAAFPTSHISLCFFNFSRNVINKISQVGLKNDFDNIELINQLKCLSALAFVPPSEVEMNYLLLADSFPTSQPYRELLDYFENTYVRNPIYSVDLWNHYDTVLGGFPKTINFCKGFHNSLRYNFEGTYLNVWTFLEGIKIDIGYRQYEFAQLENSQSLELPSSSRMGTYESTKIKLHNLVASYHQQGDKLKYLRSVADLAD